MGSSVQVPAEQLLDAVECRDVSRSVCIGNRDRRALTTRNYETHAKTLLGSATARCFHVKSLRGKSRQATATWIFYRFQKYFRNCPKMDFSIGGAMNANEEGDDVISVGLQHVIKASSHWLELFDKAFGQEGVPFQQRPLKAAMRLVNDGILEISGGSKEKYWSQPWFTEIVKSITTWYKDRYGAT